MSNNYIKSNPCHPGEHLRECIRMEGLTVKQRLRPSAYRASC